MTPIRIAAAVLVCLMLGACASTPTPLASAKPVPAARIHVPELLQDRPGTGSVIVTRDHGTLKAAGIALRLLVDGTRVVDLRTSETVTLHLPAGQHVLSVTSWDVDLAHHAGAPETGALVMAGQTLKYRIGVLSSGDGFISPTAF